MLSLSCPNCGAENELGAERCQECNSPLVSGDGLESSISAAFAFSSQEEQDLPDLLSALKQDGEISTDGEVLNEENEAEAPDLGESGPSQEEEDIPDWLKRIRERAKEETDAAGEITQKLSAAQESLAKGKPASQEEEFASWIQGLRRETDPDELASPSENAAHGKEADEELGDAPAWLSKIRKVKGPTPDAGQVGQDDKQGDSLLQWLVALEEGKEAIQPLPGKSVDEDEEISGNFQQEDIQKPKRLAEDTKNVPLGEKSKPSEPELDVNREEQIQANLFSSLVVDEGARRPIREPNRRRPSWAFRLAAAVLLIGLISVSLYGGWPGERFVQDSPATGRLLEVIKAQTDFNSVLIVADYQAGFADEIHQIAKPVLGEALTPGMQVGLISTQPAGVLLSRRLLAELPGELDLQINDLGYYPTALLGAYAASNFQNGEAFKNISPEIHNLQFTTDLDGVILLADSYEGARFWIEQLSAQNYELPLYLLVTAQAGPLLTPYQDSGQVAGMAAGISGADAADDLTTEEGIGLNLRAAYQMGTLLIAVMIIIGAIFAGKPKKTAKDGGDL